MMQLHRTGNLHLHWACVCVCKRVCVSSLRKEGSSFPCLQCSYGGPQGRVSHALGEGCFLEGPEQLEAAGMWLERGQDLCAGSVCVVGVLLRDGSGLFQRLAGPSSGWPFLCVLVRERGGASFFPYSGDPSGVREGHEC